MVEYFFESINDQCAGGRQAGGGEQLNFTQYNIIYLKMFCLEVARYRFEHKQSRARVHHFTTCDVGEAIILNCFKGCNLNIRGACKLNKYVLRSNRNFLANMGSPQILLGCSYETVSYALRLIQVSLSPGLEVILCSGTG